jgi:hypothetical protein
MNDEAEIFLDMKRGWVIRTPMRVPDSVLLKMCRHALDTYAAKLTAMPDGAAKRRLDAALKHLAMMRVTQDITR